MSSYSMSNTKKDCQIGNDTFSNSLATRVSCTVKLFTAVINIDIVQDVLFITDSYFVFSP
jgi:hypothetical protein